MTESRLRSDPFLALSATLTGFSEVELRATGQLEEYRRQTMAVIGERESGRLLTAYEDTGDSPELFRTAIWDSPRFGPVVRRVLGMWYLGVWSQLPRAWRERYGATSYDTDRVVSAAAYREGLVWPAGGTHPMSAKQQGYGSWARPSSVAEAP